MKFEEYIKANKEKLQPKVNKDAIWDQISNELPPKKESNNSKYLLMGLGAALLIICLSLYGLNQKNDTQNEQTKRELIALKSEIHSLINTEKTSSKIRAVNLSQDAEIIDQEIIATLIDRLVNDKSSNVQIAAARALEQHIHLESVRIAMIDMLSKTSDPYLQIKLIDMLAMNKENRILPFLDSITSTNNKKSIVLDKAEKSKKVLREI